MIDTYNHEKYIRAALESVLGQKDLGNATIDIVVVDDGSTDKTGEIVRSFGKDIVRYYYKPNGGQASAFNFGIPLCRSEIICFLDGDDWWDPTKLKVILEAFQKTPELCGIGHGIVEVDETSGTSLHIGPSTPIAISYDSPQNISLFHQFACCLGTSRLAMRRSTALQLLDVPEALTFEADEYLFTLLPTLGKVTVLPEMLTYYRIHGGNLYQDSRVGVMVHKEDARLARRASVYQCLAEKLPTKLRQSGLDHSITELLLGPVYVQASRLKLLTVGGTSVENFKSERRAANVLGRNKGAFDKLILWTSLGLALLLPPKRYFRLRHSYSNFLRQLQRRQ